jgi:hypothetical protein
MRAASCGGSTPAVLGFAGGGQVEVVRDEWLAFAKACARKTLRSASYPLLRSRPHFADEMRRTGVGLDWVRFRRAGSMGWLVAFT